MKHQAHAVAQLLPLHANGMMEHASHEQQQGTVNLAAKLLQVILWYKLCHQLHLQAGAAQGAAAIMLDHTLRCHWRFVTMQDAPVRPLLQQ